ncbi:MAG: FHA domain-containing protein [Planctomycetota bacterium]
MTWRFGDFLSQVKGLDETGFRTMHPYALLLSEGQGASGASGKMVAADIPTRKIGTVEELAAFAQSGGEDAWVIPVRRKEGSQLSIITVGRGEECDIRLAHPLISKKHAYFQQDAEGWLLADAESTNCTFVDGDKLEAHKPRRLNDSVVLRFGPAVKYRFFLSQSFHAYCSMRARMKDPATEPRRAR